MHFVIFFQVSLTLAINLLFDPVSKNLFDKFPTLQTVLIQAIVIFHFQYLIVQFVFLKLFSSFQEHQSKNIKIV